MPSRPLKSCSRIWCRELTNERFCTIHKKTHQQEQDKQRGTAKERGYTYRWSKYSKWFLKQPENIFCKLQLSGCNNLAECVDHIDPEADFWDKNNHQAACIRCNSKKGRRNAKGEGKPFDANSRG